jgi:single-stranded-DNA-specific exonuclease
VLEAQGAAPTRPTLGLDGALQVTGASTDLVEQILRLGPFGVGNSEPRFALPAVRIVHAEAAGADHVRCALAGGPGGRLRAIAFRAMDSGLGAALLGARGLAMHVAGRLKLDRWQGREEVQLFIDDVAPASGA